MILPVVDQDVLIFDSSTAESLRNHGIMGNLIGSLSLAPQQNNFLGLPLKLLAYEVVWLVENRLAKLQRSIPTNDKFYNKKAQYYITPRVMDMNAEKLSITTNMIDNSDQLYCEFRSRVDPGLYSIFSELRSKGYFILPGFKFGGEFIAYPGDPLRYHSHLIVNSYESINFYNLIVSGRLASGVKKLFVVSMPIDVENTTISEIDPEESEKLTTNQERNDYIQMEDNEEEENELKLTENNDKNESTFTKEAPIVYRKYKNLSFSIEWAGFG